MAIKHVVTLGFGFADNTVFIPTLGFTPGAVAAVDVTPVIQAATVTARAGGTVAQTDAVATGLPARKVH